MYVTQPTLSRQIAELEEELGVKLFVRENRTIRMTEAGKVFAKGAKSILSQWNNLIVEVQNSNSPGGSLNIGFMGNYLEQNLLSEPIHAMGVKYPSLNMNFRRAEISELYQLLQDNLVDVIYIISTGLEQYQDISYQKIADNHLQIVVPDNHPLADKGEVSISDIRDESFVLFERSATPMTVDYTIDLCLRNGFSPSGVRYARDAQSVLLTVSAGKGIAFLSSRLNDGHITGVRFLDIEDDGVECDLVLAYKKDNHNPYLKWFLGEFQPL